MNEIGGDVAGESNEMKEAEKEDNSDQKLFLAASTSQIGIVKLLGN